MKTDVELFQTHYGTTVYRSQIQKAGFLFNPRPYDNRDFEILDWLESLSLFTVSLSVTLKAPARRCGRAARMMGARPLFHP